MAQDALRVEGLASGYGRMRIVDGVSLSVSAGEVVALIGHNGMGKTTFLRTVLGQLTARTGSICLGGRDITREATAVRSRLGLGYVPQGRQIFPDLTVMENLRIGELARTGPTDIPAILKRFAPLSALLSASSSRPG